jgi:hypothetical protein
MTQHYSVSSKGTCTPISLSALIAFKLIQKEANRFQDAAGKKLLACDGKIGSNTVAAINGVATMFPTSGVLGKPVTSCRQVADSSTVYVGAMKGIADQNKLAMPACPKGIIQSITNPEPVVDEVAGTVVYPGIFTATGPGGLPLWLIALMGVGGVYYFKSTKGGRKQWKSLTGGS